MRRAVVADALGERDAERVAITVYGLTLLAILLLLLALDGYARRKRLYSVQAEGEELRAIQRKSLVVVVCYLLTILLGLVLPAVAMALYFGLAVYLVLPSRPNGPNLHGPHAVSHAVSHLSHHD